MKTEKAQIFLPDGSAIQAAAPMIVSASRATDIPAFYSEWFFNRLDAGYVRWINPYNGKGSFVSFANLRFIVFWSKNPEPILPYLSILQERGIGYYFQYTLNDYQSEGYEPNLPGLERRISTFKRLVDVSGPDSAVWRFDPLLLTNKVGIDELLSRISAISERLNGYTDRFVFSFADISSYAKVARNLQTQGVRYREWTEDDMLRFAMGLKDLRLGMALSTCAERIDLSEFSISHNRCIDPELIIRRSPQLQNEVIWLHPDKGQRKLCGCIASKDIGQYNTCPHGCVYCYANTSPAIAASNHQRHINQPTKDSIIY